MIGCSPTWMKAALLLTLTSVLGTSVFSRYQHEWNLLNRFKLEHSAISDAIARGEGLSTQKFSSLTELSKACWEAVLDRLGTLETNPDFFSSIPFEAFAPNSGGEWKLQRLPTGPDAAQETADLHYSMHAGPMYLQDMRLLFRTLKDDKIRQLVIFHGYAGFFASILRETVGLRLVSSIIVYSTTWRWLRSSSPNSPGFAASKLILGRVWQLLQSLLDTSKGGELAKAHRCAMDLDEAAYEANVSENWALSRFISEAYLERFNGLTWKLCNPERLLGTLYEESIGKDVLSGLSSLLAPLDSLLPEVGRSRERGRLWSPWRELVSSLDAMSEQLESPPIEDLGIIANLFSEIVNCSTEMLLEGNDELLTGPLGRKTRGTMMLGRLTLGVGANLESVSDLGPRIRCIVNILVEQGLLNEFGRLTASIERSSPLDDQDKERLRHLLGEVRHFGKVECLVQFFGGVVRQARAQGPVELWGARSKTLKRALSEIVDGYLNDAKERNFQFGIYKGEGLWHILERCNAPMANFINEYCLSGVFSARAEDKFWSEVDELFSDPTLRDHLLELKMKRLISRDSEIASLVAQGWETTLSKDSKGRGNSRSRGKGQKSRGSKKKGGKGGRRQGPTAVSKGAVLMSTPSPRQTLLSKAPRDGVKGKAEGANAQPESQDEIWTRVTRAFNRLRESGSQNVRDVMVQHIEGPLYYDAPDMESHIDHRENKTELRVATLNTNWAFLFDILTGRLSDKLPWKSQREAWDHLRDVARAIRRARADIVQLSEVQDGRILQILAGLLKDLGYRPFLIPSQDSLGQHVGMLVRAGTVISVEQVEDTAVLGKSLVLHLRMENGYGNEVDVVVSGVHLMSQRADAGQAEDSASRRQRQARLLKQYLKKRRGDAIHIVLGDFNEECSGEAVKVIQNMGTKLHSVLNEKAARLLIDHIFVSAEVEVKLVDVLQTDQDEGISGTFLPRVSDHPMIVATILLPEN